MPGPDPNHLTHQQPHVAEKQLPDFNPNHQITAPRKGCRARQKTLSWPLTVAITRAIGSRRFEG
eukprot:2803167-Pleurochrysis_carterae.AAC.3